MAETENREPSWAGTPASFECKPVRVEFITAATEIPVTTSWEVSFLNVGFVDAIDRHVVAVTGHLVNGREESWGQIIVAGSLTIDAATIDRYPIAAHVRGHVEQLWDVARRTLGSLCAAMDAPPLELPFASPAVDITEDEFEDSENEVGSSDQAPLEGLDLSAGSLPNLGSTRHPG